MSKRYDVVLDWFDGDDSEQTDVEADTLDEAARRVWDEWAPTGWTLATLSENERYVSLNLEAKTFELARVFLP